MTIYDGSAFGAIDQQAYTDGRPSDEWLRRKIENNVAHLTITEPPVTVMRRGGDVASDGTAYFADRAICSHQRTVFLAVPVWVTSTTAQIKFHLNMVTRRAYPRPLAPETEIATVLIAGGVRSLRGTTLGVQDQVTVTKTGTYDAEGLTTIVIPMRSTSDQWAVAYLTVQSAVDDQDPSEKSQLANAFGSGSNNVTLNIAGATPLYDPAVQPTVATTRFFDRCVLVEDSSNAYADVLAFDVTENAVALVPTRKITPGAGSDMTFMGILPLTWMQMRSYTIEVLNSYNIRESELLYNLPERGIDSLRHGQGALSLRARYRLVAAGPTGWMPPTPIRHGVQGRHPQIWESAFGVARGGFGTPPTTLIKTGATESFSDGVVKIVMLVHACVHNGLGLGTVDWEFAATVKNWIGTPETLTATYPIKALGTLDAWTFTTSNVSKGKWIPSIQLAAFNAAGTQFYACRDGQFLESEFGDLTLVEMTLPMPATGGSVGLGIDVTAKCVGNVQEISMGANPLSGQHLTCVAWSVYVIPEEAA